MAVKQRLGVDSKERIDGNAEVLPLNPSNTPSTFNRLHDQSLIKKLRKAGLDPQKLLEITLPKGRGDVKRIDRHFSIKAAFVALVVFPAILFSAYMFFIAEDQYHSTIAFAVRSSNSTPATEVLGMVLDSGSESTTSNSYIIHDYLQSQAILEEIEKSIDLEGVFNNGSSDWLFQLHRDLPVEDRLDYWNRMVDVEFDATSGVIFVEVRSFSPMDSVKIAGQILKSSENLVNRLSEANRRQSVRFAEEAVARAETRLKTIRRQLLQYREQTQEVSPEDNARIALEMIAELDQRVAEKEAERRTLSAYLNTDSPRVRIMTGEIEALKDQIETERKRLGSGDSSISDQTGSSKSISFRIASYSDLKLEEDFANQLYTTALASLEQSRQEADKQTMYLATFISPTLSEKAQYPSRSLYSIAVFFLLCGIWVVAVLMYYNIRDRN